MLHLGMLVIICLQFCDQHGKTTSLTLLCSIKMAAIQWRRHGPQTYGLLKLVGGSLGQDSVLLTEGSILDQHCDVGPVVKSLIIIGVDDF